jgi:hypothetical protein
LVFNDPERVLESVKVSQRWKLWLEICNGSVVVVVPLVKVLVWGFYRMMGKV